MASTTSKAADAKAANASTTSKAADADGPSNPDKTRLDLDTSKPSTTAPGDGPADTTDPAENASTVGGDKTAAALAGHKTVNAAVPIEGHPPYANAAPFEGKGRIETYKARRADGTEVTVTHNIDTGETSISS